MASKVIDGKMYNTETADLILQFSLDYEVCGYDRLYHNISITDTVQDFFNSTGPVFLYQKKNGELFFEVDKKIYLPSKLYLTVAELIARYATSLDLGDYMLLKKHVPDSDKYWCRLKKRAEKDLDGTQYEIVFGIVPE